MQDIWGPLFIWIKTFPLNEAPWNKSVLKKKKTLIRVILLLFPHLSAADSRDWHEWTDATLVPFGSVRKLAWILLMLKFAADFNWTLNWCYVSKGRCFSVSFWACSSRSQKLNKIFLLKTFATSFKMLDILIPLRNIGSPQIVPFQYAGSKREMEDGSLKQPSAEIACLPRCTSPCCSHPRNLLEQCSETKKAWIVHAFPVGRTCKWTGLNFYFKCIILHVYFLKIMTVHNVPISFIVCT